MVKRDDLGTESCAVVMFGAYVKLLHSNKRYYAHAERSWPYPHNILAGPGTINGEILVPEVGKSNLAHHDAESLFMILSGIHLEQEIAKQKKIEQEKRTEIH